MKLATPGDNGSQSRSYVIQRLIDFGIAVAKVDEDWYEVTDRSGDMEILFLDDPIPAMMVVHLWRRFGCFEGMLPTDLVEPKTRH